jgi:hypothetical protein
MEQQLETQIESVRSLLLKNKKPSYQTTNRKEVRIRCCYCGDSKKDPKHAHMYVEMKPPFKFYCQKCNTAGVLNTQTLKDLNIFNNDISINIIEANKSVKTGVTQKISLKRHNTILNKEVNQQTFNCSEYMKYRYNKDFNNDYIVDKFKGITNFRKFIADNNIPYPIDNYRRPLYDFDNSIGFLSSDGSHVIFRDITGKQPKRYFNLNLFGDSENAPSNKIYNIKASLDILQNSVTIVMTEGIFDIIGVYEHFYKDKVDLSGNNYIFAAAAGKGYGAVISHYIRMGLLNLNVIIYSDSDVDIGFFKELKSSLIYLKNTTLTIFYNTIDKDFGVPIDKIQLRKAIV